MKQLLLILTFTLSINAFAQDNKTVSLIVSGQGETQDEARQNALRSAIEQAFGTFISSNTEILNDSLIKDEIISISNGNIQEYNIVSEIKITDGNYGSTIKAVVSVSKLTSFVESKGIEVEFKGGLFSANIQMQELYEKNEVITINNLIILLNDLSKKSFDYSISASNPSSLNGKWKIPLTVNVLANENFRKIPELLEKTLSNLALSRAETENYVTLKKKIYPITIGVSKKIKGRYFLRKKESVRKIIDYIFNLQKEIIEFEINSGVEKFTIYNKMELRDIAETGRVFDPRRRVRYDPKSCNFIVMLGGMGGCRSRLRNVTLFHHFQQTAYENWSSYSLYSNPDFFSMQKILVSGSGADCGGYQTAYKGLKDIRKLITQRENSSRDEVDEMAGFIISFSGINYTFPVFTFKFDDIKSLEELKKIKKYEIYKK